MKKQKNNDAEKKRINTKEKKNRTLTIDYQKRRR